MPRTLKPELVERIRPLVEQGRSGSEIAKAVGIGQRESRWYAQQIRDGRTDPNGSTPQQTLPTAEPVMVPLDQITPWRAIQARERMNQQVIQDYVEAMQERAEFPAITLFVDDGGYWMADGFHRFEAAKKVGFPTIKAEVRPGGLRDAQLWAAQANQTHGLRRSNSDKQRAVLILLADNEWQRWSDRRIARHCGVTHPLVAKLRKELSGNDYQMPETRQARRGETVYEMDTSHIGAHEAATTPASGAAAEDLEQEAWQGTEETAPATRPPSPAPEPAKPARQKNAPPGDRQAVQACVFALLDHAPDAAAWPMLGALVEAFVTWAESKLEASVWNALVDEIEAIRARLPEPPKTPTPRGDSREQRWLEAAETLVHLQEEYRSWRENMPDNLQQSRTAELLDEIDRLNVEELLDVVHPLGFGRD